MRIKSQIKSAWEKQKWDVEGGIFLTATRTEKVVEPHRKHRETASFFFTTTTTTTTAVSPPALSFFRCRLSLSNRVSSYLLVSFLFLTNIMTGRGGGGAARKTLLSPIHYIFKLLQVRSTVSIWLYEQLAFRIEGKIRVGLIQACALAYKES